MMLFGNQFKIHFVRPQRAGTLPFPCRGSKENGPSLISQSLQWQNLDQCPTGKPHDKRFLLQVQNKRFSCFLFNDAHVKENVRRHDTFQYENLKEKDSMGDLRADEK
jgi:hypothetical protein